MKLWSGVGTRSGHLWGAVSHCGVPCHLRCAVSPAVCRVTLWFAMSHCGVSCHLWCAMSPVVCCVMLCSIVLCCVTLYCAVLSCLQEPEQASLIILALAELRNASSTCVGSTICPCVHGSIHTAGRFPGFPLHVLRPRRPRTLHGKPTIWATESRLAGGKP